MKRSKVIIIEDNLDVAVLEGIMLSEENYQLQVITDPRMAIDESIYENVCVVVVDLAMPYITGLEVMQWIRARFNIPLVVVTASHDPSQEVKDLAYRVIQKTEMVTELVPTLRKLCRS